VARGDGIAAAERYFHPDIVYIVNGPPVPVDGLGLPALSRELHSGLPSLGMYRGLDEVRAFLTHMHANLDVTGFGPREIVGDDQHAAVFGWFGLRSRAGAGEVRSAFSVLLEQRDGKIAQYQFLENTFDVGLAFAPADRGRFEQTARPRPCPQKGRSRWRPAPSKRRPSPSSVSAPANRGRGPTPTCSAPAGNLCYSTSFNFAATQGSSSMLSTPPESG
jgi:ketosteroid isomerase-like protein